MKQWPLLQIQLTQTERQCRKCKAPVSWRSPRTFSNFLNLTEPAGSLQESTKDEFLTKTNMQKKTQHWSQSQGRSEGTGTLLQSMPGHEVTKSEEINEKIENKSRFWIRGQETGSGKPLVLQVPWSNLYILSKRKQCPCHSQRGYFSAREAFPELRLTLMWLSS